MPQVGLPSIIAVVGAIILVYVVGNLLLLPVKVISKLVINGIIGAVVLFALNALGTMVSFSVAINPITALVAGFLGVPGILLLIFLQYTL